MFESVARVSELDFPDFVETKDHVLNFCTDVEIERLIEFSRR
jgi:hypothetical protein